MSQPREWTGDDATCQAKTMRGNLFLRRAEAQATARRMSRDKGRVLVAYHCPVCGNYHVGRQRSAEKKRHYREQHPEE